MEGLVHDPDVLLEDYMKEMHRLPHIGSFYDALKGAGLQQVIR